MIFHPQNLKKKDGHFIFSKNVTAIVNSCLNKSIYTELWHNFTFGVSDISFSTNDKFIFSIGKAIFR